MPKISFLIATKNRGDMIKDTLDSLIKQDISEWEAIIVDDHGSDNTKELVAEYQEKRFRYYTLNKSHGMGVNCARNFGAMMAKSEIIAILDSDDIVYPHRARVTVETFENDASIDVFYSSFDFWVVSTGKVYERNNPPVYDFDIEIMKKMNYIPHCTLAVKKKVLLENPYNTYFRLAEDYELTSRLACASKKFKFSPERLMKYRLGEQNVSNVGRDELVEKYDRLVKMLRGWLPFDENLVNQIKEIEDLKK